ncbi:hypothetical protein ACFCVY_03070 [Streptomyces sp. NPDC056411]|uniref:hypothetical protein n=1 Tax=Streptomyces sp. NPDC056411 TaxID=3345813 RepID=UPI0035D7004E
MGGVWCGMQAIRRGGAVWRAVGRGFGAAVRSWCAARGLMAGGALVVLSWWTLPLGTAAGASR